jgi:hypothetical protein
MRPTFSWKSTKLFAAAAVLAFSLPGYSQASNYFVNMTELSSTQLSVAYNLPGYGAFSGTVNEGSVNWEAWGLSPVGIAGLEISAATADGLTSMPTIFWQEPDDPGKWNVFGFFIQNAGQIVVAYSDLTSFVISSFEGSGQLRGCTSGGAPAACPVLTNGQTQTVPLYIQYNGATESTMDVTFTDQGDVASATPLPSTWLMLLSGFVGLGYLAYRGTKKRTALAAA